MFVIFYSVVYGFVVFFFFKQKTAYEMRISDWSSDVCSSDLGDRGQLLVGQDRVLLTRLRILEGERLGEAVVDGGGRRDRAERGEVAAARAADARGLHPRGRSAATGRAAATRRSEEHTSELQSLMRISYAVFCLKNKTLPIICMLTSISPTVLPFS